MGEERKEPLQSSLRVQEMIYGLRIGEVMTKKVFAVSRNCLKVIVFANTLFQCVQYGFADAHIVTSGTDRKIGYWETLDGSQTRELDGASCGAINSLDMSPDGQFMVSGGEEKLIKVWTTKKP